MVQDNSVFLSSFATSICLIAFSAAAATDLFFDSDSFFSSGADFSEFVDRGFAR